MLPEHPGGLHALLCESFTIVKLEVKVALRFVGLVELKGKDRPLLVEFKKSVIKTSRKIRRLACRSRAGSGS